MLRQDYVPPEQWSRLERELRPLRLRRGEFFLRPGDDPDRVAVVRSGLVRFYYVDRAGRESTKAFRKEGELVAAFAELLTGRPSRTHVQAVEDTELLALSHARLRALYGEHPCWQELGRRIAEEHYVNKEQREYEFLQLSALERYRLFERRYPGLAARLPQYHIASYLGITPVALSRLKAGGGSRPGRARKRARAGR
jgi:CRP-like cAMP-binding protein